MPLFPHFISLPSLAHFGKHRCIFQSIYSLVSLSPALCRAVAIANRSNRPRARASEHPGHSRCINLINAYLFTLLAVFVHATRRPLLATDLRRICIHNCKTYIAICKLLANNSRVNYRANRDRAQQRSCCVLAVSARDSQLPRFYFPCGSTNRRVRRSVARIPLFTAVIFRLNEGNVTILRGERYVCPPWRSCAGTGGGEVSQGL